VTADSQQTVAGLTPQEIFDAARAREGRLSRLLVVYIGTGLTFMLLPGTFLGVWNLISISTREVPQSVSPAWLQAHGHAQIFGWIGSFILGIGFHSIPRLSRQSRVGLAPAWMSWACWTVGVSLRWVVNVYGWHWRVLLPVSAGLELAAFLIFFRAVSRHRSDRAGGTDGPETWVLLVIGATCGFLLALLMNAAGTIYVAVAGDSPAFPAGLDQRFLPLETWGFLVPFIWGFSARWLPVFMGLRPARNRALLGAFGLNAAGIACALAGWALAAAVLTACAAILAPAALGLFVTADRPAKTRGVHPSFPLFIRTAYAWAVVAAVAGIWAEVMPSSAGLGGASRHALTVGFVATMVFSVGQRILPAFSGGRVLFSPRLMLSALLLLNVGCGLRVSAEILAYQHYAAWAWHVLPASAVIELTAVSIFAANLALTFVTPVRAPA
jgi:hypothetical protein